MKVGTPTIEDWQRVLDAPMTNIDRHGRRYRRAFGLFVVVEVVENPGPDDEANPYGITLGRYSTERGADCAIDGCYWVFASRHPTLPTAQLLYDWYVEHGLTPDAELADEAASFIASRRDILEQTALCKGLELPYRFFGEFTAFDDARRVAALEAAFNNHCRAWGYDIVKRPVEVRRIGS